MQSSNVALLQHFVGVRHQDRAYDWAEFEPILGRHIKARFKFGERPSVRWAQASTTEFHRTVDPSVAGIETKLAPCSGCTQFHRIDHRIVFRPNLYNRIVTVAPGKLASRRLGCGIGF